MLLEISKQLKSSIFSLFYAVQSARPASQPSSFQPKVEMTRNGLCDVLD